MASERLRLEHSDQEEGSREEENEELNGDTLIHNYVLIEAGVYIFHGNLDFFPPQLSLVANVVSFF